jgi:uncharacterized protein YkwD
MRRAYARDRSSGAFRCFAVAALVACVLTMRFSGPAEAEDITLVTGAGSEAQGAGAKPRRFARSVLRLQNRQRRAHGLRSLRPSRKLRRAANRHARDMVRRHYFGHVSFGGRTVVDRVGRAGYGRRFRAGENLFYVVSSRPSPAQVVAAWMASPPHRHQILNPAWREVGIGTTMRPPFGGRGGVTAVGVFGARGSRR